MRDHVQFYINGNIHTVNGEDAFLSLSDYLRERIQLKGTKVVCAEGDCGACTVLVTRLGVAEYKSINACIAMVALLDDHHIITIEGLKKDQKHHPIQEAMVQNNGAQCGYCSPGIVMSLADMFENKSSITEKTCRNYLTGNLCRCTGYGSILDAAMSVDPDKNQKIKDMYPVIKSLAGSQDLEIKTEHFEFHAPASMATALKLKEELSDIAIISSATDIGVQVNKDRFEIKKLMSLDKIKEAHEITVSDSEVTVGARVNLDTIENVFLKIDKEFSEFLHIFASPQIKNFGTLIGNIANASPIGDSLPFLSVMEARLILIGSKGRREVLFNEFYKGYKKLDLESSELISQVIIPRRDLKEHLRLFKVSRRKDLDISCVNAAIKMKLDGTKISEIKIAYGGVGPTVLRLPILEKELTGKEFCADTFRSGSHLIKNEITPMTDVRGTAEYRHLVAKNLFQRFYLEMSRELA